MYYSREIDEKETIPYPICSVVAVLKMLIRILNTLRSRIWDMVLFLFLCFGSGRNKCNSLWGGIRGRKKSEDSCLLGNTSAFLLRDVRHITYDIRFEKNNILWQHNDKIIMYSDRFQYHLIISETWKKVQHSGNSIGISHDLLSPSLSLSQRLLNSFTWSQQTENKKNRPLQI